MRKKPDDVTFDQWQAIVHEDGHLIIIAGPGTGKTHTLTRRIAYFIHRLQETQRILAITFTNKAAEEMRERLELLVPSRINAIEVGTFHGFCLQLLRQFVHLTDLPSDFYVATPQEIEGFARLFWRERTERQRKELLEEISQWKSMYGVQEIPKHIEMYNCYLRENGLLDFDDLLWETVRLLRNNEQIRGDLHSIYQFVFVDEYQDINEVQHTLLKELVGRNVQLTAIGDPNQAIYGFRGSDVRLFKSFCDDFLGATTLYLSENYRSSASLIEASGQVMGKARMLGVPEITAKLHIQGRLVIFEASTDKAEAEYVVHQIEKMVGGISMFSQDSGRVLTDDVPKRSFGDVAVLYRLNIQKNVLQEAFLRSGIPYEVSGDRPLVAQPAIFEILTLLQLANGNFVSLEAARRLLECIVDGVGNQTGGELVTFWQKGQRQVRFSDIVGLGLRENLSSERARNNLKIFCKEVEGLADKMRHMDVRETLQYFMELPCGKRILAKGKNASDNYKRLLRLSIGVAQLKVFIDNILLKRADDAVEIRAEKVHLLTLHAAKGLEFPVVFIIGCEKNLLPLEVKGMTSDPEEERRLFYVGMSRAKESLHLIHSKKRRLYGKICHFEASPFLADIKEELKVYERIMDRLKKTKSNIKEEQLSLFDM